MSKPEDVGIIIEEHRNGTVFFVWDTTLTENDRIYKDKKTSPPGRYKLWWRPGIAGPNQKESCYIQYSIEGVFQGYLQEPINGKVRKALLWAAKRKAQRLGRRKGLPIIKRLLSPDKRCTDRDKNPHSI